MEINRIYLWTSRVERLNDKVNGTDNTFVIDWIVSPTPPQIHTEPSHLVWLYTKTFKEVIKAKQGRKKGSWVSLMISQW